MQSINKRVKSKNLTVGFDVTWMNEDNKSGGVFQYAHRLITAFAEYTNTNVVAITGPTGEGVFDHLKERQNFREVLMNTTHLFANVIMNEHIDVIHTPVQFFHNCTFSKPMISTLHDLQHFYYPEFFTSEEIEFRNMSYKYSAEFSERVIVSYEHVKEDIVKFYGIHPQKIDVCPLGFDSPQINGARGRFTHLKEKYHLPEQYLFYSANTWKHKNHIGLIKALKLVHEKYGLYVPLVCTGQKYEDYFPQIQAVINEMGLNKFVLFVGYIPEEEVRLLLKNSILSIIPTLYEAGSFPLMEAMAHDVPVICSNVTSLPSIIGDERFVFEPHNTQEMAEKIAMMLTNEKLLQENRENSRNKIKEGKWDQALSNFINSYTRADEEFKKDKTPLEYRNKMDSYELLLNKIIERNLQAESNVNPNCMIWTLNTRLRKVRKWIRSHRLASRANKY